jgi:hypothetical protein
MRICPSLVHLTTAVLFLGLLTSAQVDVPQARIVSVNRDPHDVGVLHLRTGYVSSVRLPEEVRSVVLGNPGAFKAEHSEAEPRLVFFKPTSQKPRQSNALITTITGREVSLTLINEGAVGGNGAVDYVLEYERPRSFLIDAARPSLVIGDTRAVEPMGDVKTETTPRELELPAETNTGALHWEGKQLRVAVRHTKENGGEMTVAFSVFNSSPETIELLPARVQLVGAGKGTHKKAIKAEPLPIRKSRMTSRRLAPGGEADGVVVFDRPAFKESWERLTLEIAPADQVDRPVVAPIAFVATTGGSK